jgi:hypothetical protein
MCHAKPGLDISWVSLKTQHYERLKPYSFCGTYGTPEQVAGKSLRRGRKIPLSGTTA